MNIIFTEHWPGVGPGSFTLNGRLSEYDIAGQVIKQEEFRMAKIGTNNLPNPSTPPGGHPPPLVTPPPKPPRPGR